MRRWPASQVVLRLLVVAGLVGAVVVAGATGHPPGPVYLTVVVVASLGAAVSPESGFGTVAPVLVVGWWLIAPGDSGDALHPAVLVAAALLLLAHVAALATAYGPDHLPLTAPLAALWVRRGLLVLPAAPLTYAVAVLARGQAVPSDVWVSGVVVVAVAALVAGLHLRPGRVDVVSRTLTDDLVERVLSLVERIPRGRVTTYGAIGDVVGVGPRLIGNIMARHGGPVPWWRVVRADGSLPPSHQDEGRQSYLEEGTPLRRSGASVDIVAAFWQPPPQRKRPR